MNPRVVVALLLLGAFLGPATGVLNDALLRTLAPVMAFALGWTGAAFGSRFEGRWVRRVPRATWRRAAIQAGASFLAVAAIAILMALLVPALRAEWRPLLPVALALGAVAAVSEPARSGLPGMPRTIATLETGLGILVFALALAIGHPRGHLPAPVGAVGWLLLEIGSGVLVGLLFLGLARLRDPESFTLALVGAVLFGAGAGFATGLSPFAVCAVAAGVIANRSPERRAVAAQLAAWEPMIHAVLVMFAGALLGIRTLWVLPAALLLAATRAAARWTAGRLPPGRRRGAGSGGFELRALTQDGIAIALGINFLLVYRDSGAPAPEGVLTTVVIGVVLAQLAAASSELTGSPTPAEVS